MHWGRKTRNKKVSYGRLYSQFSKQGSGVQIKIRWHDFVKIAQGSLSEATLIPLHNQWSPAYESSYQIILKLSILITFCIIEHNMHRDVKCRYYFCPLWAPHLHVLLYSCAFCSFERRSLAWWVTWGSANERRAVSWLKHEHVWNKITFCSQIIHSGLFQAHLGKKKKKSAK